MDQVAARLRALIMRADQSSGSLGRVDASDIDALRAALWLLETGELPTAPGRTVSAPGNPSDVVGETEPLRPASVEAPTEEAPTAGSTPKPVADGGPVPVQTADGAGEAVSPLAPELVLCLDAAQRRQADESATLCVDFGTAASKAFAMRGWRSPISLPLGQIAGSQDHFYPVESSFFVGEDGYVRFGPRAVEASLRVEGRVLHRFDSLKTRFNAGATVHPDEVELHPNQNLFHTEYPLTEGEGIRLYLAYLMSLIGTALEQKGLDRHLRRRIARPCWTTDFRERTRPTLWRMVAEGQVLADTFGSRLQDGISLKEAKRALTLLRELDSTTLEQVMENVLDRDIAEALAVSAPLAEDMPGGWHFVFVIDVGAGTTDFGIFLTQVFEIEDRRSVRLVPDTLLSLSQAGDYVDSILHTHVIHLSGMDLQSAEGRRANIAIRNNLRRLKETLYREGRVSVPVDGGRTVDVELEQFMALGAIRAFGTNIAERIQRAFDSMPESYLSAIAKKSSGPVTVLVTGGGHALPMVRDAVPASLVAQGQLVHLRVNDGMPRWAEDGDPGVRQAYRLLAVAAGGASPELPTEQRQFATIG